MSAKSVNCPKCTASARVTMRGRYRNAQDLGVSDFRCVAMPGNAGDCPHLQGAIKQAIAENDQRQAALAAASAANTASAN